MGQTSSNIAKKVMSPFTGWTIGKSGEPTPVNGTGMAISVSPFVFTRRGSMYYDEDGDLAHEFYEEMRDAQSKKRWMRRLRRNLTPQGELELTHPRLHCDFPVVLCEATR